MSLVAARCEDNQFTAPTWPGLLVTCCTLQVTARIPASVSEVGSQLNSHHARQPIEARILLQAVLLWYMLLLS